MVGNVRKLRVMVIIPFLHGANPVFVSPWERERKARGCPALPYPNILLCLQKRKKRNSTEENKREKLKCFISVLFFYLSSYMNFASTIATRQSGGSNGVAFLIRGCSPLKCTWLSWSFGFYFATINLQHLFLFTGFGGSRCFPS